MAEEDMPAYINFGRGKKIGSCRGGTWPRRLTTSYVNFSDFRLAISLADGVGLSTMRRAEAITQTQLISPFEFC